MNYIIFKRKEEKKKKLIIKHIFKSYIRLIVKETFKA